MANCLGPLMGAPCYVLWIHSEVFSYHQKLKLLLCICISGFINHTEVILLKWWERSQAGGSPDHLVLLLSLVLNKIE